MIAAERKRNAVCKSRRKHKKKIKPFYKYLAVFMLGLIFFLVLQTMANYVMGRKAGNNAERTTSDHTYKEYASSDNRSDKGKEKLQEPLPENMRNLENALNELIEGGTGTWSIYVKDLSRDQSISINNQSLYAASLIKLFVLEASYANLDSVSENARMQDDLTSGADTLTRLFKKMIEISDNESYNELVRLNSESHSFTKGCLAIQEYLENSVYSDTGIYHTLSPSNTANESTSLTEKNHTSVEDCGHLLEAIYNGTCVSQDASEKMLDLLLKQERRNKIPAGVPDGITVANKTGETEECEHDTAIVYGDKCDYVLCVMSKNGGASAAAKIIEISETVYNYLNGTSGHKKQQNSMPAVSEGKNQGVGGSTGEVSSGEVNNTETENRDMQTLPDGWESGWGNNSLENGEAVAGSP